MADETIPQLTSGGALSDTTLIVGYDDPGPMTKRTAKQMLTYVAASGIVARAINDTNYPPSSAQALALAQVATENGALDPTTGMLIDGSNVTMSAAESAVFRDNVGLSSTTVRLIADNTGATDTTAAWNAQIAALQAGGGGTLWVQKGTYKISGGSVGADGFRTGIAIPQQTYSGSAFGQNNRVRILFEPGAEIFPGNANTIVMRIMDQFSIVDGPSWTNPSALTGCYAYAIVPADLGGTTVAINTNYNKLLNYNIQGYEEGIVLQSGPTVSGTAGECYENWIIDGQINNTKRGIWFKDGVVGSQGANRNWIVRPRIGNAVNTGIQIDAADTIMIDSPVLENINTGSGGGTSPNAVCTALKILTSGPVSGWECYEIKVWGAVAESCDRDLDCAQDDADFISCTFDWTNKVVLSQTPQFYSGHGYNPSTPYISRNSGAGFAAKTLGFQGLFGAGVAVSDTPTVTIEAIETGSGAVATILSKTTAANGVPEVRLDTAGNYGYYSFYQSGALQWTMGSQATGVSNITFFDSSSNPIYQFPAAGNGIRIYNSQTPATASATGTAGTICWDSGYIYVCVATNTWKRVAVATW